MTTRDTIRVVGRLTRQLRGMMRGLVRRATLGTLTTGGPSQVVQSSTLVDDVDDDVELLEQYGFTSAPPGGSEGLVLRVGGERAQQVAVLFGKRSARFTDLEQGEVAVYNEAGAALVLRNDGSIEALPAPGQTVKLGAAVGGLAVARATDPILLDEVTLTAINAMAAAFVAVEAGLPVLAVEVVPATGMGTITAGGQGSTST